MKTSYKYLAIAFATLLCSCNEGVTPDTIESQVQISVNITPCVLTRVTEDGISFTNGDAIKVQNLNRENKNLATYTYSESTGKWSTSDELYWDGDYANTFNAWYPVSAAYESFTIQADQTSGIADADWMTATTSAKKADGTVNLSFNHNLAKVTVTIDSWSNEFSDNEKVADLLELNSLSSVMSYNGTLSGDNTAKWVKAYVAQTNTSFVAIIAPATYASGEDIMQIYVNGSSTPLAVKTSSDLTIEAGKAYGLKLTIGKNMATITSSVTIGGWDDVELDNQQAISDHVKKIDYIDEYGINHGTGVDIDGVIWAPVNCGYHATDFKYGKYYQWGRKYGQGYDGKEYIDGSYVECQDASVPSVSRSSTSLESGQSPENENICYMPSSTSDWTYESSDNLWNSGTESEPIKTEYDPCPTGWRVPTYNETIALGENTLSSNEDGQLGFLFSGSKPLDEADEILFLALGGRWTYFGYADDRRNVGYYWTSRPDADKEAYYLLVYSQYVMLDDNIRMYGCSVRCVQE